MTTLPLSLSRTARLTRWNAALLVRNRAAFFYAVGMPLLPLLLLLSGDRGDRIVGANTVATIFLIAGLFPVYYNVLSQFVGRREELVLKRMRTGETKDGELLASIALPGALCALAVCVVAVPVAAALGQPLPLNPVVYAALALAAVVMFAAFAFWTAAWTRSAESAQLTSIPVILIASIGPIASALPNLSDSIRNAIELTPGAAMADLLRSGWFGLDGPEATKASLSLSDTWSAAAQPLAVIVVWTALAIWLASRSLRWEPRA